MTFIINWMRRMAVSINQVGLLRIPVGAEASIVLVGKDDKLEKPIMAFIRLAESSYMPNVTEVGETGKGAILIHVDTGHVIT